ncbi:hypothetical protein E1B28_007798 [Marasmius oreades]|uniref:Uncharacterized protein n=1 Tax=Marasmius oreades TaxID=181124 RepID=A0A9P7S3S7_9AGAR|nr:uncharacterized protein E1B28_007798 [Marasmius oreades]KAG7094191.1 hypothetical protein E1B28_007798 [Marasmius oreades]
MSRLLPRLHLRLRHLVNSCLPPPDGQQLTAPQGDQQNTAEAYAAYWAQYGYDLNSPQFKEWTATQQQQQYSQYYAQAGYNGVAPEGDGQPQPPQQAPPPPPPPPS